MPEAKTRPTDVPMSEFLATQDPARRSDCEAIAGLMQKASGEPPVMWGSSIVGFGSYRLRYANGSEADWPLLAFSPRKSDLTLYLLSDYPGEEELLAKLGRHKRGKSCLYIRKLADVDQSVLVQMIEGSLHAFAAQREKP